MRRRGEPPAYGAPDVRLPLTRAGRPVRERLAEILFRIAGIEEDAAGRPAPALAR